MQYDWPLEQARAYDPALPAPEDLERFWSTTLAGGGEAPTLARVDSGLVAVETYDVTFSGCPSLGISRVIGRHRG